MACSGAGYIRWIFGYCSNRLDILRPLASARGSAKSPRKLRLKSGTGDVVRVVELSIGDLVAGRPCFDFCEFLFGFFEFLFFFRFTKPTVYVGTMGTAFPLLFFRPAWTTTGRVALLLRTIGFRNGIGSFLAAGEVVPYNIKDQSCKVARPTSKVIIYNHTSYCRIRICKVGRSESKILDNWFNSVRQVMSLKNSDKSHHLRRRNCYFRKIAVFYYFFQSTIICSFYFSYNNYLKYKLVTLNFSNNNVMKIRIWLDKHTSTYRITKLVTMCQELIFKF